MQTLLYLEDDDALAFVTKRALEARHYRVAHYSNLNAARQGLAQREFDCALLDLKIGNETSLRFIQQIKGKQRHIPIVLITGYGSVRTTVQAMRLGAINYLSKPCSISDIVTALTDAEFTNASDQSAAPQPVEVPSLRQQEWEVIQRALEQNAGNVSATARQLKLHRRTLQRKLAKKVL